MKNRIDHATEIKTASSNTPKAKDRQKIKAHKFS